MDFPTREELRKLKVVELRQRLSKLSLPQSGVKEDLITRLLNGYQQQGEQQQAESVPAGESPCEEEEAMEVSTEETGSAIKPEQSEEPVHAKEEVKMEDEGGSGVVAREEVSGSPERSREEERPVVEEQIHSEEVEQPVPSHSEPAATVVGGARESPKHDSESPDDSGVEEIPQVGEEPPTMVTNSEEPPAMVTHSKEPPTMVIHSKEPPAVVTNSEEPPTMVTHSKEPPAVVIHSKEPPAVVTNSEEPPTMVTNSEEPPMQVSELPISVTRTAELPVLVTQTEEPPAQSLPQAKDVAPELAPLVTKEATRQDTPSSDYFSDSTREEEVGGMGGVKKAPSPPQQVVVEEERQTSVDRTPGDQSKGKKRKKKRRRRRHGQSGEEGGAQQAEGGRETEHEVEIEYVQEDIVKPGDLHYRQFHKIFEAFKLVEPEKKREVEESPMQIAAKSVESSKKAQRKEDSDEEEEEEEKEIPKISKKKLQKMNRLTVAQLKQLVDRPDVVEMHDVTAQDPRLLIHLKSTRNTVSVPRHWCYKRKYLQGKRGIEKPPFDLPDFIKATGIMEMRQALEEKEEQKSLKQKTRERVRPKMGKLTIDYQKLHDAFFRWQTKPKMTIHGDLYYEGKEFETRLKEKKPGDLSDELRRSLGMPTGPGKNKFPPPWLVAMQRYGPPPSYPNLKISGLNAPIPEGCSFGYFVGGWGKPPVDETGRPLYGDVFGVEQQEAGPVGDEEEIDKSLWGELESEEEEEEEEEESEEEREEMPKPEEIQAGLVTPIEGLVTPSGLTSIPAGLETPEMIQLRKKKIEEAMEQGGETPALYTVLPEKAIVVGGAMMGSAHVYDLSAAVPGTVKKAGGAVTEGVEVALDPSELDLDTATMTAKYEEQLQEQQSLLQKEDLSDMVAEHAARQKKRKRAAADSGGKSAKKLKEFKF